MAVVETPTVAPTNARVVTLRLLNLANVVKTLTHYHIAEDPVLEDVPRTNIWSILQDLIDKVRNV